MKKLVLLSILLFLLVGCGTMTIEIPGVVISKSNLRHYNNAVAISNDSNCSLEACEIGSNTCTNILPWDKAILELFSGLSNWYASRQIAILVRANCDGKITSIQKTFFVSTGNQRSEVWIITNQDFAFR